MTILAELCARTEGFLFTKRNGRPVPLTMSSRVFRERATAAGLKGMRFHFLRHTFGIRLGDTGVGPYEIARLMGHSNLQTSMIYVHPTMENLRQASEAAASRQVRRPADTRKSGVLANSLRKLRGG